MAYTTINKSTEHFNTKLYTGTGSQLAVTGVGFQPDFIWFKNRGTTNSHGLQDVVRGFNTTGIQSTNGTDADPSFNGSTLGYVSAAGSDGFTVEAGNCANASGNTYVGWNWKANGAGSSNTDGSITSTVSANTTSGFSIITYTGNGTSGATIGHGLGAVPKMIIIKRTDSSNGWGVYHHTLGTGKELYLNYDFSEQSSNFWITTPTTSVFSVSNSDYVNLNTATYVAYCFAEKTGYSKFGSYVGNGNADGTFVYTGFKPAFVIVKCSTTATDWELSDNKRTTSGGNVIDKELRPNTNGAETGGTDGRYIDYLSNGFKLRQGFGNWNNSGDTYIYMAFAEAPLVGSNGVTAKAR
jgi:hypothetical protein